MHNIFCIPNILKTISVYVPLVGSEKKVINQSRVDNS